MRKQELLRPLAEAKEKSGKGEDGSGGRGNKKNPLAKMPKGLDTRREAAKEAGIGERTLDAVKLIKDAADKGEIAPEVIDDIRHRKIAIHRVAKDIKETRQKAAREEKRLFWQIRRNRLRQLSRPRVASVAPGKGGGGMLAEDDLLSPCFHFAYTKTPLIRAFWRIMAHFGRLGYPLVFALQPFNRKGFRWRRGWDSNPRNLSALQFSRLAQSTTLPPLLCIGPKTLRAFCHPLTDV